MRGQRFGDKGLNHRTIDLLHDLSRSTSFGSHFTNLPYHLLDPSRRTNIICVFLEGRCLRHESAPFGEKRNKVAVNFIDPFLASSCLLYGSTLQPRRSEDNGRFGYRGWRLLALHARCHNADPCPATPCTLNHERD